MALPPKFAGHRLTFSDHLPSSQAGVPPATHTMEIYLDYSCPFSGKIFANLHSTVFPMIRANAAWAPNLQVIFRQQVQPWHPSSTLTHEAGLAVLKVDAAKFWEFSRVLFERQRDFFDISVVNETRNETYKRLVKIAGEVGLDEDKMYELLKIPEKPGPDGSLNPGNGVYVEMKLITKMNRLTGVHVTPTVVFDGVVQDVSSGWTEEQWKEFLTKMVV